MQDSIRASIHRLLLGERRQVSTPSLHTAISYFAGLGTGLASLIRISFSEKLSPFLTLTLRAVSHARTQKATPTTQKYKISVTIWFASLLRLPIPPQPQPPSPLLAQGESYSKFDSELVKAIIGATTNSCITSVTNL